MLKFPEDWRLCHGGFTAEHLFHQLPESPLRNDFARHLIGASLELALVGLAKGKPPRSSVEAVSAFRWRVGECTYLYLPGFDNKAFAEAVEFACRLSVTLIVPPKHEDILRCSCETILKGHKPVVFSLGGLIAFRVSFTSADLDWPHDRVLIDLFRRYNGRVAEAGSDRAILVDLPCCPEESSFPATNTR